MFNLVEQEITTKLFFNCLVGVGLSGFFIFLIFWLSNQKAMFKIR